MIRHRRMALEDLRRALDWAAEEGWNPGLDDAEAFYAADPGGFFVAEEDGKPVASISVVNHNDDFAFLGLYICRPECRGRGIGFALWEEAMAHAGQRTIGLDGVAEQQANYARSGFVLAGTTRRFSGDLTGREVAGIDPADTADIPTLIDREAQCSGVRKEDYLSAWFRDTAHRKTFVASSTGFVTVRRCRDGAKIGPLIAEDENTARDLIAAAAAAFPGPFSIDVPDSAPTLAGICETLGLSVTFETARMYRGTPPVTGDGLFAVTTLELG
ncbi:GNAT family N-acetyltransferase [Aestuariibius sp. 2305UL40-4]|uniref:GNAT family N-acetyltransferase n=1 Tax=Aestuariibius violaceus TaxID=3234132 RepID=UPI00345ED437